MPAPSGNPPSIAPVTYSLADSTAVGTSAPSASHEAIAEARVQPRSVGVAGRDPGARDPDQVAIAEEQVDRVAGKMPALDKDPALAPRCDLPGRREHRPSSAR